MIKKLETPEEYDLIRTMFGIPESSEEIGGQFPLNMHLHLLNGVAFDKGCYIGQELTQRTFHTGVIRRVALPFLIISKDQDQNSSLNLDLKDFVPLENVDKSFDLEIKGEQIFGKKGEDGKLVKIGKVLASKHNIGIALIDLTKLDKLGSQVRIFLDDYKVSSFHHR